MVQDLWFLPPHAVIEVIFSPGFISTSENVFIPEMNERADDFHKSPLQRLAGE